MKMKKIGLFISRDPIKINFCKWSINHYPILLVTGLAGSGKTTLCACLAKRYNAKSISLDALKFFDKSNKDSQNEVIHFLELYPEITDLIKKQWAKNDKYNTNDFLYKKYCLIFFDYLINKYKTSNKLIIIEGIQIFVRLPLNHCVSFPCCVLMKSSSKCMLSYILREYCYAKRKPSFITIIHEIYLYHIKQRNLLNKYISIMLNKNNYQYLASK